MIYNIFLSPLRGIPGPFLAKVTGYWLILVDLAGDRTSTIHKLHQRYGTAVRIGPSEVSFSNIESIKEIYSQQTSYMKAPIYETMSIPPLGIFSLTDKHAHSQRRKYLSHAFSQSNLLDTEPLIVQKVEKVCQRASDSNGKPIDMLSLFRLLAFDIVGLLFESKSCNQADAMTQASSS